MYLKRNIILHPTNENENTIIASIESFNNKCNVTLKNLNFLPNYETFIVICNDENFIFTQKLTTFQISFIQDFNVNANLFVYICSFKNENLEPKFLGSNTLKGKSIYFFQTNKSLIKNAVLQKREKEEIKVSSTTIEENKELKQQDNFNNEILQQEDKNEPSKENEKTLPEPDFFEQIKDSINLLISSYPHDEILETNLQNSIFVSISSQEESTEKSFDYYSVGILKEDDLPKYICVAFPCKANSSPPKQYEPFCQYLQINDNLGYFLMYQDAKTGENIIINNQ